MPATTMITVAATGAETAKADAVDGVRTLLGIRTA
jgi:hypothetical protein